TAAITGLVLVAAGRLLANFRQAGSPIGNGMILLSFMAATMLVSSRTLAGHPQWASVILTASLGAISLLASALPQPFSNGRRGHLLMAALDGLFTVIVMTSLSRLTGWQKLEIASILGGLALLGIGHAGWYREQHRRSEMVSFNLLIGSLMAGLPLLIA